MTPADPVPGTLQQCLKYYLKRVGTVEASRQLAAFMRINQPTASRWVRGKQEPKGENLIRLWYFLEHMGYQLNEVDSLQPEVADLGRLIAHRYIEPQALCDLLGYATVSGLQRLWEILKGQYKLVDDKLELAQMLVEEKKDLLNTLKSQSTVQLAAPTLDASAEVTAPRSTGKPANEAVTDAQVTVAVVMISGLRPIVMQLANADPELHARVREEVGSDIFYEVLDAFKRMSSRHANRFFQDH